MHVNPPFQAIERYMKQALVDRSSAIASAALVSGLHMSSKASGGPASADVIKRWVNEAQEAVASDSYMVQYHALGLLYHIRKSDRLAVNKLVTKLTRGSSLRSPYAVCMLIRIACKMIEDDEDESSGPYFDFVESCLRHKSEMVIYEAAHAIVNMKKTTSRELVPAISVLQLFCSSPKATLRFAAVRTLNQVSMSHPAAVTACNLDLENLITDSNRSIATLAITTLLKTGAESSVDRLMKQIATFVSEISDEFKAGYFAQKKHFHILTASFYTFQNRWWWSRPSARWPSSSLASTASSSTSSPPCCATRAAWSTRPPSPTPSSGSSRRTQRPRRTGWPTSASS